MGQVDGQRVVVPNAMLFENAIWIRTDQPERRVTIVCGVAYGEDVDEAGIEIPFPYRTLTFKEPLAVQGGAPAAAGSASGSD